MTFFSGLSAGLTNAWTKFDNFCARTAPGFKSFVLSAVGVLGSVGAATQEYLTGVPLDKFATAQEILWVNIVLFSLVFFARHLTNVAASNASVPQPTA